MPSDTNIHHRAPTETLWNTTICQWMQTNTDIKRDKKKTQNTPPSLFTTKHRNMRKDLALNAKKHHHSQLNTTTQTAVEVKHRSGTISRHFISALWMKRRWAPAHRAHHLHRHVFQFHMNQPDSLQPAAHWTNKHDKSISFSPITVFHVWGLARFFQTDSLSWAAYGDFILLD